MYNFIDFLPLHRMTQNNSWWFIEGKSIKTFHFNRHFCAWTPPRSQLGRTLAHVSWSLTWSGVAGQPFCKMELSESVQRGLRLLADPSVFDLPSFQVLVDVSLRSLLSSHGDPSVLGELPSPARRRLCLAPLLPVVFPCGLSKQDARVCVFTCVLVRLQHIRNRFLRVWMQIFC